HQRHRVAAGGRDQHLRLPGGHGGGRGSEGLLQGGDCPDRPRPSAAGPAGPPRREQGMSATGTRAAPGPSDAAAGPAGTAAAIPAGRRGGGAAFWASAAFLGAVVAAAVLAPLAAPHDPAAIDFGRIWSGPTAQHPLGTDQMGRDLLSRVVYGARESLLGPLDRKSTRLNSSHVKISYAVF